MEDKTSRYQSRILREMRHRTENPFSSPPSSTGSHGTVTLTSELSHFPDGESTRRMGEISVNLPSHGPAPKLNTSALGRTFPEWDTHSKKEYSFQDEYATAVADGTVRKTASLFGPTSPKLRARQQVPIAEDTMELNSPRGNVTTLLDTLKTARADDAKSDKASVKQSPNQISPKSQPNVGVTANAARRLQHRQSHLNANMSSATANQTGRSFFLPNLYHINDFVSGTLRWSSLKNGTPIFVKHGKVHDWETKASPDHHADFEAITIPQDEEEIFVSLDKIREEIQTLQEHDEIVSKQAEQLHDEVYELQTQIAQLKSRKDSAMGSESESSMIVQLNTQKSQLEEQVSSLQARLDEANRKISLNEIHTQSYIAERDEALQKAHENVNKIKRLQARNNTMSQQKLEIEEALKETQDELDLERKGFSTMKHLQARNNTLNQQNLELKESLQAMQEELDMERENVATIKRLQSSNNAINQQKLELEEALKETLDGQHLERGLLDSLQYKYKIVMEEKNALKKENIDLQNKVADLQELADGFTKRFTQKTEARQYTQESEGFMTGTGKSKLTKMAQIREPRDRRTVVSEMPAKTSHKDWSKQDEYTQQTDFTQESQRQYTQESAGSKPSTSKPKLTKLAQIRESRDRQTVVSEMSAKTVTSQTDLQMQDDYTQQINLTQESQPESVQENMTSALFMDDITLNSNKKFGRKQKTKAAPAVCDLTPSAKRVLNDLCHDHECYNCMVCARIKSHRHDANGKCGKKTVRIDRPVPVTDRVKSAAPASVKEYEDQHTLRPSQDPALALAKVMKGLKDEESHIRTAIAKKQMVYDECDAAMNKRLWKKLDAEIKGLRKRRDLKRDQIYDLNDVLEGQKANAQKMSQEAIDMTITSVLSKDPTWNGITEY
ncbi:hypothetical protein F5Y19DRAFT_431464 [Xylariaceae sp. FL1651]|nr:hypothetical protein F5Y19DRAFT_431464 [Xylariaceae sp. FL1651]